MSKGLIFAVIVAIITVGVSYKIITGQEISAQVANAAVGTASATAVPASPKHTKKSTALVGKDAPKTQKSKLLFFMNPNGKPCQIQDEALLSVRSEIEKYAEIVYIKTTNPVDEEQFYRFGIRSLPSLIILNAKSEEFKRFSPGIQNPTEILASLKGLKL